MCFGMPNDVLSSRRQQCLAKATAEGVKSFALSSNIVDLMGV